MTEPNSTLKLRVKTSDRIGGPQVEETVNYRWDRIIIALVVILACLSVAIWAWLQWHDSTTEPRHTVATGPIHAQPLIIEPVKAPADSTDPEAEDIPSSAMAEPVSVPPAPVTERAETDIGVAEPVDISAEMPSESTQNSSTTDVVAAETVEPADELSESPAVSSAPEEVADRDEFDNDPVASDTSEAMAEPAVPESSEPGVAMVSIDSSHLQAAGLTRGLKDKEPVDQLPANLKMNDKGVFRIYFFNMMADLKGQTVFHDWYLNDERVAHVRIQPYSDLMRASSAKYINRNMLGQWRVEAVTDQGEVLGSGQFTVSE
ncbi:DUF2914 domain-containing protein [Marinobacter sp. 1Y8]